jgi:catechol 2,3-dioxygenase-like lactoylglutathione lyase family enzyme
VEVREIVELVLEVADLAAAERFYVEVLGLPVAERWPPPRPAVWLRAGSARIGLWPPETGGARGLFGSRGGAHVHFALGVDPVDLDRRLARLRAMGVAVEGPVRFSGGDRSIYVRDPDGHLVEFWDTGDPFPG